MYAEKQYKSLHRICLCDRTLKSLDWFLNAVIEPQSMLQSRILPSTKSCGFEGITAQEALHEFTIRKPQHFNTQSNSFFGCGGSKCWKRVVVAASSKCLALYAKTISKRCANMPVMWKQCAYAYSHDAQYPRRILSTMLHILWKKYLTPGLSSALLATELRYNRARVLCWSGKLILVYSLQWQSNSWPWQPSNHTPKAFYGKDCYLNIYLRQGFLIHDAYCSENRICIRLLQKKGQKNKRQKDKP